MRRADRDMLEDEVEASIARANAECEGERRNRGTLRVSCTPDAASVRVNEWARWFVRHPFSLDLVACAETNS